MDVQRLNSIFTVKVMRRLAMIRAGVTYVYILDAERQSSEVSIDEEMNKLKKRDINNIYKRTEKQGRIACQCSIVTVRKQLVSPSSCVDNDTNRAKTKRNVRSVHARTRKPKGRQDRDRRGFTARKPTGIQQQSVPGRGYIGQLSIVRNPCFYFSLRQCCCRHCSQIGCRCSFIDAEGVVLEGCNG